MVIFLVRVANERTWDVACNDTFWCVNVLIVYYFLESHTLVVVLFLIFNTSSFGVIKQ